MQFRNFTCIDDNGRKVANATVTALQTNTQVPVSLFDESGAAISGPLLTDANGAAGFRVANGNYDVRFSYVGRTATYENEQFLDGDDVPDAPWFNRRSYDVQDPAFGAICDGDGVSAGTDNTTAIQNAINGLEQGERLTFTPNPTTGARFYNVSKVVVDAQASIYSTVEFNPGVRLFGAATTPQDAVLEFRGSRNMVFENINIRSDGNGANTFQTNYHCAMMWRPRLTSEGYSSDRAFQFNTFKGGQITDFKRAIVIGAKDGETAPTLLSSENKLIDFDIIYCEQSLLMNNQKGYVELDGCMLIGQNPANNTWFDDATGFLIKTGQAGKVLMNGGSLQRAIVAGHGLYGKGIKVNNCVYEFASPNYVEGDMEITDPHNGFISQQTHTRFEVAPNATGRLVIRGQFYKNNDVVGGNDGLLVDSTQAPNMDLDVDASLIDMQWDQNSPLFVGGRQLLRRVTIRDDSLTTPTEYDHSLTADSWDWSIATPTGDYMSTTVDNSAKGGWTQRGGAAGLTFFKETADTPDGFNSAIRFQQASAQVVIGTPAPTGTPGSGALEIRPDDTVMSFKMKRFNAASTLISVLLIYYDHASAAIGSTSGTAVFQANTSDMTGYNMDSWQQFSVPVAAPEGAKFVQVRLRGSSSGVTDIGITDMRFV